MKVRSAKAKAKGRKRMTTFTSTDAELRRLLCWYNKHGDEILHANAQYSSHNTALSSLKSSEKKKRINELRAAEMTWRESQRIKRDKQQQPITKFFNITPKNIRTMDHLPSK